MNNTSTITNHSEHNELNFIDEENVLSSLLVLLSTDFLNASPKVYKRLSELPSNVIIYLRDNVSKYSWINHLSLAMISCDYEIDTPLYMILIKVQAILKKAVPLIYPTIETLDPEDAIVRLNRDFDINYSQYCSDYMRVQDFTDLFLDKLDNNEKEKLQKFRLPRFNLSIRLNDLLQLTKSQSRTEEEIRTEPIKLNLIKLLQMSCIRTKWMLNLFELFEEIKTDVKDGKLIYPADLCINSWDGDGEIKFRMWDRKSWILSHIESYSKEIKYSDALKKDGEYVFLQYVGKIKDNSWFLKGIEVGALQTGINNKRKDVEYIQANNLRTTIASANHVGLLTPEQGMGEFIMWARKHATGDENDSSIIFDLLSLVTATAVGNLALQSIGFTGIRMSELQQLSFDNENIKVETIDVFNDQIDAWEKEEYYTWNFYVKDRDTKIRVFVYRSVMNYIKEFKSLHQRFHDGNSQQSILCLQQDSGFTLNRLFPEPRRFVFQWKGRHIAAQVINACIEFVLLEHGLTDINGEPVRISAKGLRHGFAGYLHRQGVPIEYIQQLLHHVYYRVSEHYSKPTHEDIFQKINPLVNQLGAVLSLDTRSILTIDDFKVFSDEVLKKFGAFRRVCGGRCGVIQPCDVISSCPGCSEFRPDPSRREEIVDVIESLKNSKRIFEEKKQYIQVQQIASSIRDWELVLREVDSWSEILLMDLSSESLQDILPPSEFGAEEAKIVFSELKRLSDGLRIDEKEEIGK